MLVAEGDEGGFGGSSGGGNPRALERLFAAKRDARISSGGRSRARLENRVHVACAANARVAQAALHDTVRASGQQERGHRGVARSGVADSVAHGTRMGSHGGQPLRRGSHGIRPTLPLMMPLMMPGTMPGRCGLGGRRVRGVGHHELS